MATLVSTCSGAPMPEMKLEPMSTNSTAMAIQKIGPRRSFFTSTASRYYGVQMPTNPRGNGR